MRKVTEIFNIKPRTFSFELFPPKTDKGWDKLMNTLDDLVSLKPDYFSCTYGAGGGNRGKTLDICEHIQNTYDIPAVAHLTCVLNSREQIRGILQDIYDRGIRNILALRGDPPLDQPDWKPGPEHFRYSCELAAFIREHFKDEFAIGVAGFPEGHILCPDRDQDAQFLKNKLLHGADFVVTQLFLDNQFYTDYVDRLRGIGVNARVIPGILPIANYDRLLQFSERDGITIPQNIQDSFIPLRDDKEATREAGKQFAVEQCRGLLKAGAPGLHFYTLNKSQPVADILKAIRSE